MPRSNHPRRRSARTGADEPATGRPLGVDATEDWAGRPYVVRRLSGSPGRTYRCPGCDQEVGSATAHVVAWPADDRTGADRRHWHTACWAGREHRRPTVQRSRNAPRY